MQIKNILTILTFTFGLSVAYAGNDRLKLIERSQLETPFFLESIYLDTSNIKENAESIEFIEIREYNNLRGSSPDQYNLVVVKWSANCATKKRKTLYRQRYLNNAETKIGEADLIFPVIDFSPRTASIENVACGLQKQRRN